MLQRWEQFNNLYFYAAASCGANRGHDQRNAPADDSEADDTDKNRNQISGGGEAAIDIVSPTRHFCTTFTTFHRIFLPRGDSLLICPTIIMSCR